EKLTEESVALFRIGPELRKARQDGEELAGLDGEALLVAGGAPRELQSIPASVGSGRAPLRESVVEDHPERRDHGEKDEKEQAGA
ncbi:MAG: hypothetical protein KY464_17280, partial [Gemmatimonadetes bacterium]|nr:hypothetical protein [Gemmatimonadota bacterium]